MVYNYPLPAVSCPTWSFLCCLVCLAHLVEDMMCRGDMRLFLRAGLVWARWSTPEMPRNTFRILGEPSQPCRNWFCVRHFWYWLVCSMVWLPSRDRQVFTM